MRPGGPRPPDVGGVRPPPAGVARLGDSGTNKRPGLMREIEQGSHRQAGQQIFTYHPNKWKTEKKGIAGVVRIRLSKLKGGTELCKRARKHHGNSQQTQRGGDELGSEMRHQPQTLTLARSSLSRSSCSASRKRCSVFRSSSEGARRSCSAKVTWNKHKGQD